MSGSEYALTKLIHEVRRNFAGVYLDSAVIAKAIIDAGWTAPIEPTP